MSEKLCKPCKPLGECQYRRKITLLVKQRVSGQPFREAKAKAIENNCPIVKNAV